MMIALEPTTIFQEMRSPFGPWLLVKSQKERRLLVTGDVGSHVDARSEHDQQSVQSLTKSLDLISIMHWARGEGTLGFSADDLDEVFSLLARVGDAVVATVGPHSEVVIHDLRDPEHTVVAISGNLTRRSIGSPVPDPEFLPENLDRFTDDLHLYRTETPFGKSLLSSTVWVRDRDGQIVGALCINMDFADIRAARDLLERAITPDTIHDEQSLSTFATSGEDFVTVALNQILADLQKEKHQLEKDDKVLLIQRLRDAGVFNLRRSSELVAAELGISRASVYSYLKDLREQPELPSAKVIAE